MKRITINNKEYTLEYSIEASLYDECTKTVMDTFVKASMSAGYVKDGDAMAAISGVVESIANLPQKVVTLFYAGLLEHHGNSGDHSVKSRAEAKNILVMYLKESGKSFVDVNNELLECIGEDNFFDLTGLSMIGKKIDEITEENMEEKPKRGRKKKEDGNSSSEK